MSSDNKDTSEAEADAAFYGLPASFVPQQKPFEIWAVNERAFSLFQQCQTQWRYLPMGGISGLDYPGIIEMIKLYVRKNRRELFEDIQILELGFLSGLKK